MDSLYDAGNFAGEPCDAKLSRRKNNSNVEKIIKRLRKNGIIVNEEKFAKELMESYVSNPRVASEYMPSSDLFYMGSLTVDSIAEAAKKWREYLQDPEDFESLLRTEIVSMLCCHASVFSVYFCEKNGFKMVEARPSPSYSIIIDREGNVKDVN